MYRLFLFEKALFFSLINKMVTENNGGQAMIIKSKIVKDTLTLTLLQLLLDTAALLLNVFITRRLGAAAMGTAALTGAFLALVGIISNGNAFLCTSRLISEESGKADGNPNGVLKSAVILCLLLSVSVSSILIVFSERIGIYYFKSEALSRVIRLMPFTLITGACSACFKGYFNAMRRVAVTAGADILEFIVRASAIILLTLITNTADNTSVCRIMIGGMTAGNCFSLMYYLIMFVKYRERYTVKPTISFRKYVALAIPVMAGGILTTALSSTNDALIPMTLRQYGDSASLALSRFGVFEAIVIPALFFPSVILCSLSGIIVSESARATASCNTIRIKSITKRLVEATVIYSILAAAVLMKFGENIGILLGGGSLAGEMIRIIAPVIPFIYLEIVLEALIKGMGLQGFSSLNYLAEYIVRISAVLIIVPRAGFTGIVISYYASNIIGNAARLYKIIKYTKIRLKIFSAVIIPVVYIFLTMGTAELLFRPFAEYSSSVVYIVFFTAVWASMYIILLWYYRKALSDKCGKEENMCNMHKCGGVLYYEM